MPAYFGFFYFKALILHKYFLKLYHVRTQLFPQVRH